MKKACLFSLLVLGSFLAQSQTKKLTWTPWVKVSPDIKAKLKKMKSFGGESVYQEIVSQLESGGTASLAVVDLDGDGKAGYAVGFGGAVNCGSDGCSFTVFEKDGKMRIDLTDTWQKIAPAKGGIISSKGEFIALEPVK